MNELDEAAKHAGSATFAGLTVGGLFGWWPPTINQVSGTLAIIWFLVLLYDRFIGGKKGGAPE